MERLDVRVQDALDEQVFGIVVDADKFSVQ